jgi:ABC-type Mn2+/Zn2+ transport system permease subunit
MKNVSSSSGLAIGGATLIGMGLGHLFGHFKAFMFIGIGVGLVVAAMMHVLASNKNENNTEE